MRGRRTHPRRATTATSAPCSLIYSPSTPTPPSVAHTTPPLPSVTQQRPLSLLCQCARNRANAVAVAGGLRDDGSPTSDTREAYLADLNVTRAAALKATHPTPWYLPHQIESPLFNSCYCTKLHHLREDKTRMRGLCTGGCTSMRSSSNGATTRRNRRSRGRSTPLSLTGPR